jgi:hypothetical protein
MLAKLLILLIYWRCSKKWQGAASLVFRGLAQGLQNLSTLLSTDFWGIVRGIHKSVT